MCREETEKYKGLFVDAPFTQFLLLFIHINHFPKYYKSSPIILNFFSYPQLTTLCKSEAAGGVTLRKTVSYAPP